MHSFSCYSPQVLSHHDASNNHLRFHENSDVEIIIHFSRNRDEFFNAVPSICKSDFMADFKILSGIRCEILKAAARVPSHPALFTWTVSGSIASNIYVIIMVR